MMESLDKINDIIDDLNIDIYEIINSVFSWVKDDIIFLELTADGYCCIIEFLGIMIWNSDNDERFFDENKNEYEDLKGYLIKEIKKILSILKMIKFKE